MKNSDTLSYNEDYLKKNKKKKRRIKQQKF